MKGRVEGACSAHRMNRMCQMFGDVAISHHVTHLQIWSITEAFYSMLKNLLPLDDPAYTFNFWHQISTSNAMHTVF